MQCVEETRLRMRQNKKSARKPKRLPCHVDEQAFALDHRDNFVSERHAPHETHVSCSRRLQWTVNILFITPKVNTTKALTFPLVMKIPSIAVAYFFLAGWPCTRETTF